MRSKFTKEHVNIEWLAPLFEFISEVELSSYHMGGGGGGYN